MSTYPDNDQRIAYLQAYLSAANLAPKLLTQLQDEHGTYDDFTQNFDAPKLTAGVVFEEACCLAYTLLQRSPQNVNAFNHALVRILAEELPQGHTLDHYHPTENVDTHSPLVDVLAYAIAEQMWKAQNIAAVATNELTYTWLVPKIVELYQSIEVPTHS